MAKSRRLPPVHPGEVLREDLMAPLGLSINGLARDLRVPVTRMSEIVNGRRSNTADTAGNRVRATTKEELWARFGQWSAQAKAAYDPDGTTELATLVTRANDDFG